MSKKLQIAAALLLLLWVPSLLAQSAGTGALTGTVTDPTGAVVPNVTVTLTSADTNQARTANTGADGAYKFSLLPPGTYRVRFAAPGFKTSEIGGVTINVTETPTLDRVRLSERPSGRPPGYNNRRRSLRCVEQFSSLRLRQRPVSV